mgnify:CR=1 FL=1
MTEKIKCSACYRKYKPTTRNRCPGCGQQATLSIDPTEAFTADLNSPDVDEVSGLKTEERISELEYQVESLHSAVGKLAWGVVLIVLSMGTGVVMITLGAAQNVSCLFSREVSCGDGGLVTSGWVVLSLGTLIGMALAAGSMTRSSSYD